MAKTHCPICHGPGRLVDARRIGRTEVPGGCGERDATERRIACADALCSEPGIVHVVYRFDVYVGVAVTKRVSREAEKKVPQLRNPTVAR